MKEEREILSGIDAPLKKRSGGAIMPPPPPGKLGLRDWLFSGNYSNTQEESEFQPNK